MSTQYGWEDSERRALVAADAEEVEENEEDEGEDEGGLCGEEWQYVTGFVVAAFGLFALLYGTFRLSSQLDDYKITNTTGFNFYQRTPEDAIALTWFFKIGLVGSVVLAALAMWSLLMFLKDPEGSAKRWAATSALLSLWDVLFIAVGFAITVIVFQQTCKFPAAGEDATCKEDVIVFGFFHTKPEVVMAILGGLFASFSTLTISAGGMLCFWLRGIDEKRAENSRFIMSLSAACVDLMDWQDFTLTLIDGDVITANGSTGRAWHFILVWCAIAFLAITCPLVYDFTRAIGKIGAAPKDSADTEQLVEQGPGTTADDNGQQNFSPAEWYCVMASLFFIEIPFFAFRTYVSLSFKAVPSSLLLKNVVSVPKEIYELYINKPVSTAITNAAGA